MLDLGALSAAVSAVAANDRMGAGGGGGSSSSSSAGPRLTTIQLSALEWELDDDGAVARFFADGSEVASTKVRWVDVSYYAKQHMQKRPTLLECGVVIIGSKVDKLLVPTGRSRVAGNGSVAVKYYDVTKAIREDDVEQFERVGIRPPNGVFTYAFFEAQYLARSEDPRRGALFLIDPRMIILQYPMTDEQKREFQTFGGKKVLYFDVLDAPNLQEREEEIKRCKIRGDEQKKKYEEADRKWEEEMEERLRKKAIEDAEKPKLSKKAKQKAKQAEKKGAKVGRCVTEEASDPASAAAAEAEEERLHKQKQAECRAKAEEEARREREAEAERKRLEAAAAAAVAAEQKRQQEEEEARIAAKNRIMKSLLEKVQAQVLSPWRHNGDPHDGADGDDGG